MIVTFISSTLLIIQVALKFQKKSSEHFEEGKISYLQQIELGVNRMATHPSVLELTQAIFNVFSSYWTLISNCENTETTSFMF